MIDNLQRWPPSIPLLPVCTRCSSYQELKSISSFLESQLDFWLPLTNGTLKWHSENLPMPSENSQLNVSSSWTPAVMLLRKSRLGHVTVTWREILEDESSRIFQPQLSQDTWKIPSEISRATQLNSRKLTESWEITNCYFKPLCLEVVCFATTGVVYHSYLKNQNRCTLNLNKKSFPEYVHFP